MCISLWCLQQPGGDGDAVKGGGSGPAELKGVVAGKPPVQYVEVEQVPQEPVELAEPQQGQPNGIIHQQNGLEDDKVFR